MMQANTTRPRRKVRKKKKSAINLPRLCALAALLLVLVISFCAAGYVIFFRTVFAQELPPALRRALVFEEPVAPVQHPGVEPAEPPTSPVVRAEPDNRGEPQESVVQDVPLPQPDLPKVAIIIDDMGYQEATGRQLLDLPFELTYSFLPFAPHTRTLQQLAHAAGKTIFLHLPLQPKGSAFSPGPGALYLQDSPATQREKLKQCLLEVPHAIGVNNHMGSSFTENEPAMVNIVQEMKGRPLIFVDSITSPASVAWQVARAAGVKSARRNIFLDNIQDEQKICRQLDKLVRIAEEKGRAIGIAHPYRATVKAMALCGQKYLTRVQYVGVTEVLEGQSVPGDEQHHVRPGHLPEKGVGMMFSSP